MLPKSFRAINDQIRGLVVFNTGGLVTPEASLIDASWIGECVPLSECS
jgi:hypothetical protein